MRSTLIRLMAIVAVVCASQGRCSFASANDEFFQAANEIVRVLLAKHRDIAAMADENGNLRAHVVNQIKFDRNLRFYESTEIIDELELVGEQKTKMIALAVRWRAEHKKWAAEMQRIYEQEKTDPAEIKAHIRLRDRLDEEFEEKVAKILRPHQVKWLKQIQIRYLVRVHGFIKLLQLKEFKEYSEISDEEIAAVRKKYRELRDGISRKAIELRKESVAELLSPLTGDQRNKVLEKWYYLKNQETPHVEQIRAHINLLNQLKYMDDFDSVFEKLAKFPTFEMTISGSFKPVRREIKGDKKRANLYWTARFFRQIFRNEDLSFSMDLTTEQHALINDALGAFDSGMRELAELNFSWKGGTRTELLKMRKKSDDLMFDTSQKLITDAKNILSPDQWKKFEQIAETAFANKSGPVIDLFEGPLGDQLRLTKSDKDKLRQSSETAMKTIKNESIEIEDELIETLLKFLEPKTRQKTKNLIGPKLKKSPANLAALIMHSAGF